MANVRFRPSKGQLQTTPNGAAKGAKRTLPPEADREMQAALSASAEIARKGVCRYPDDVDLYPFRSEAFAEIHDAYSERFHAFTPSGSRSDARRVADIIAPILAVEARRVALCGIRRSCGETAQGAAHAAIESVQKCSSYNHVICDDLDEHPTLVPRLANVRNGSRTV